MRRPRLREVKCLFKVFYQWLQEDTGGAWAGHSGASSALTQISKGCWSLCTHKSQMSEKCPGSFLLSSDCFGIRLKSECWLVVSISIPYQSSWNSGSGRKRDFSGSIAVDALGSLPPLRICWLLLGPGWSVVRINRNLGDWECFSRIWHLFNPTEVHKLSSCAKGTCLQAVEANWHSTWNKQKILAAGAKRNSWP